MQRKSGFPVANCSIKMPDNQAISDGIPEDDGEQQQRRQQLINFGHTQWGFNNWSWAVTKQDLDFVELTNGKYTAGVAAFVSVTVKSLDIHRENVGYATSTANNKGFAIYKSRKCAVTNALRETLLSFGGSVTTDLQELLEANKVDITLTPPEPTENNQNVANKPPELNNIKTVPRKEEQIRPPVKNAPANQAFAPPVAKTHPMPPTIPANRPRAPMQAPIRPNANDINLENMTEEEARAERKRRQRLAQEEFRLKQMNKPTDTDDRELPNHCSSLDLLLLELPSQCITDQAHGYKRKTPSPDGNMPKRRASETQ